MPLAASQHLLVLSIAFFTGRFGPETCSMLSRMSQLQHLDLQGSQHANATLLQAVGQISTLQSLHLSRCCQIDDAALQHITGLSNLHTLNIGICSRVTDTGLAAVTKLQSLTHLLAQQCRDVTDAGVALLGRLTKLQVGGVIGYYQQKELCKAAKWLLSAVHGVPGAGRAARVHAQRFLWCRAVARHACICRCLLGLMRCAAYANCRHLVARCCACLLISCVLVLCLACA